MAAKVAARELPLPTGARVLVVGDVMLDEYIGGTVERISPEAPVPVIKVVGTHASPGGAANVARQVVALGGAATLVGVVGADAAADRLRSECERAGIDTAFVVDAGRTTTTKQRITVGRQQVARLDRETTVPIDGTVEERVVEELGRCDPPDAIVVSDYAKGTLTERVLATIRSRWVDVPVLVDPKHSDFVRYRGATLIKANRQEFEAAIGQTMSDAMKSVQTFGHDLLASAGIGHLVVTLGADGLLLLSNGNDPIEIGTSVRDVYDVSGAGDTVIATLALAMAGGIDLEVASRLANTAAGIAVQRRGVMVVHRSELAVAVGEGSTLPAKVVDRVSVAELAAFWRESGRRIVFTNGCFDLFHAGHVHLLREAAQLGDELIVAVDTDESVRRLKGAQRPIIGETERMSVIGALDSVSVVVAFDSSDLEDLISEIAPDVLVKGTDYSEETVVGADLVTGTGGSVVLVPLLGELSTSAVVSKIRNV